MHVRKNHRTRANIDAGNVNRSETKSKDLALLMPIRRRAAVGADLHKQLFDETIPTPLLPLFALFRFENDKYLKIEPMQRRNGSGKKKMLKQIRDNELTPWMIFARFSVPLERNAYLYPISRVCCSDRSAWI